ncbi:MAG: alkaline phosphatase family protein [Saprospiraceae bacterium]|nr:alkaline phosphatase family protein [Candidatus Brachybacter algidus]MBL0118789.1 alkaline phosphatase family protein [Candidatus Brachybacter algidus]
MKHPARKVLVIGWDAADWKVLNPLMDQGLMPNLTKLVDSGVMGRIATLDPPLSPTLWTSIATGKRPYKHGIHGFVEPTPNGKGIRPINITGRKVKAIWNILNQHNMKTNVIGWWPSHPAEPVNGIYVSDFYHRSKGSLSDTWPMMPGTVHPAEMSDLFAKLRTHAEEFLGADLLAFVPHAEKIDQKKDRNLYAIAKILAECSTIHSAATHAMTHSEWDFMAVYFDAIDHFCHGFMKYHPPRQEHISPADFEMYKEVVNSAYRYHDWMLGNLLQLAGEDTTIILLSDHGFHPDHHRPRHIPEEPAGPALEHSPYGILVMKGPGIRKDETLFGASLLDITPTLLALYGLPIAEDMDGKVLVNAFTEVPETQTIKSWENIAGNDGAHPNGFVQNEEDTQAELRQLIDLGYVEDPGDDLEAAVKKTQNENNYYLARAYFEGGEYAESIALLEQLHRDSPCIERYATRLVHAYQVTGNFKDARKMVNRVRKMMDRESPEMDILEGILSIAEQRYQKALKLFRRAELEGGRQPLLHLRIAHAYLQINMLAEAEKAVLSELAMNEEEPNAYYTLGLILFQQMRYEEALTAFLEAIGLSYHFPAAHFHLGETLMKLGKYEEAAAAFDVTLLLAPGVNMARQQLIDIYENHLKQPGKALQYKQDFMDKIKGTITVVSGLPRSGTSMMMQMLEAAGLDIFTDKERTADDSNPKGYYEHEAVKNLQHNNKWLPEAKGKVVKIIAQLLSHLPANYHYQVIFMERDVLEVIASQQKMLVRDGKRVNEDTLQLQLVNQYTQTVDKVKEWAENQPNVDIIFLSHQEVVKNPFLKAMLVNDFLGGQLPVEKMASAVDKNLYREKKEKFNHSGTFAKG